MMDNPQEKNNILIVDDTPENLTVLRQMLTEKGYRVRPAMSGEIALKVLCGHGITPRVKVFKQRKLRNKLVQWNTI